MFCVGLVNRLVIHQQLFVPNLDLVPRQPDHPFDKISRAGFLLIRREFKDDDVTARKTVERLVDQQMAPDPLPANHTGRRDLVGLQVGILDIGGKGKLSGQANDQVDGDIHKRAIIFLRLETGLKLTGCLYRVGKHQKKNQRHGQQ